MKRLHLIISTVLFFLTAMALVPAQAATLARVDQLYRFEVVVENTGRAERDKGLKKGLEQVMVRATGDRHIGTHPAAAGVLAQAENFLQQYGYSEREVVEEPEENEGSSQATDMPQASEKKQDIFAAQAEVRKELVLSGHFEPAVLEKALRQAGLPVWDARRPQVLMLGVVEDGPDSRAAAEEAVRAELEEAADRRGMPLRFPTEGTLDVRTIWKGDRFALEDAARAEGVDFVHWWRIERIADGGEDSLAWVADAALYQADELVREWYFNAGSEQEALQRLVDELTDWMASRYAVASGSGGRSVIGLYVKGVDSVSDYSRVQSLLSRQGTVEKLELVSLADRTLVYRVTTRTDAGQFENSLALRRQLVPAEPGADHMPAPVWLGEIELFYQLQ